MMNLSVGAGDVIVITTMIMTIVLIHYVLGYINAKLHKVGRKASVPFQAMIGMMLCIPFAVVYMILFIGARQ